MYKAPLAMSEQLSGALFERLVSKILMSSFGELGEEVTSFARCFFLLWNHFSTWYMVHKQTLMRNSSCTTSTVITVCEKTCFICIALLPVWPEATLKQNSSNKRKTLSTWSKKKKTSRSSPPRITVTNDKCVIKRWSINRALERMLR